MLVAEVLNTSDPAVPCTAMIEVLGVLELDASVQRVAENPIMFAVIDVDGDHMGGNWSSADMAIASAVKSTLAWLRSTQTQSAKKFTALRTALLDVLGPIPREE